VKKISSLSDDFLCVCRVLRFFDRAFSVGPIAATPNASPHGLSDSWLSRRPQRWRGVPTATLPASRRFPLDAAPLGMGRPAGGEKLWVIAVAYSGCPTRRRRTRLRPRPRKARTAGNPMPSQAHRRSRLHQPATIGPSEGHPAIPQSYSSKIEASMSFPCRTTPAVNDSS